MRNSILACSPIYRSLLGCGFLLLAGSPPARAQREVELQLSGGAALFQFDISRHNLPANFKAIGGFNTAAAVRLTLPVSPRIGVGLEQRVTGLGHQLAYDLPNSRQSTGLSYNTVHQSGLSVRLYDLWAPGPRWGLDLALTGSYGWGSGSRLPYEGPLWGAPLTAAAPTRAEPLLFVRETTRPGAVMAGLELLLRYEWGLRHSLLLTAAYQRGLRQVVALRSTRLEYVDEAGAVQRGRLALSSRGSYATVQLGYGLRLGSLAGIRPPSATPRYSIPEAAEDELEALPLD